MPLFKCTDVGGVLQGLADIVQPVVERVFAEIIHGERVAVRAAVYPLCVQIDGNFYRLHRLRCGKQCFGGGFIHLRGQDAVFEAVAVKDIAE